jgi:CO dehydrogenase/acetyl-CoA synthase epsilon subunit
MKVNFSTGVTTSDRAILKRDIVKKVIYKKAEAMIVGKNALPMETSDALDLKFSLPKDTAFTPQKIGRVQEHREVGWNGLM